MTRDEKETLAKMIGYMEMRMAVGKRPLSEKFHNTCPDITNERIDTVLQTLKTFIFS